MDHGPLVSEEINAGMTLIHDFDQFASIKAAFWLKRPDDYRYLYLASDQLDDACFARGYAEVLRITKKRPSLYLNPFRINLIAGSDQWALAAVEFNCRFPNPLGTLLGTQPFADIFIDDGYIYPAMSPVGVA